MGLSMLYQIGIFFLKNILLMKMKDYMKILQLILINFLIY